MTEALYLYKIPLRVTQLVRLARARGLPLRDLDDGYLVHAWSTELWQGLAPTPFLLQGVPVSEGRGVINLWGYARSEPRTIVSHARDFGDPSLLEVLEGGVDGIASKAMPRFEAGRRVGFTLRACPVVRGRSERAPERSREVDAWLAACIRHPGEPVAREAVYLEWLKARLVGRGARLERASLSGFRLDRLVRRTQGAERQARRLERPEARFEGELIVEEPGAFETLLARGVGRHRAFGFGMMLLVPPRAS